MVFMDTAATIPTGALAERWRFVAFAVFSVFVGAVIYPIYANWTWGGGWLAMLGKNLGLGHGHVDFAGSSVVHMTGGVMAFVTAILLGPRRGKYGADGSVKAIPRSEEHTSELQSLTNLVCRLLLEKKKHSIATTYITHV